MYTRTSHGFSDQITADDALELVAYYRGRGRVFVKELTETPAGEFVIAKTSGSVVRLTPVTTANAWTVEDTRAGITLESFSDDLGTLGTPGTWYRVSDGTERGLFVTRNRGDALRRFQARAGRAQS
jgi:hypothetical protein